MRLSSSTGEFVASCAAHLPELSRDGLAGDGRVVHGISEEYEKKIEQNLDKYY